MSLNVPPVIGIIGPKGSGKSTVANVLKLDYHYRVLAFAQPIKDMLSALGLYDTQIDGDRKEKAARALGGKTPRQAMQTLGTEWGREMIDPDIWVNAWAEKIDEHKKQVNDDFVADDVRFDNEVDEIKRRGGKIIMVQREGYSPSQEHKSENILHVAPDYYIYNNGSVEDLRIQIHSFMQGCER